MFDVSVLFQHAIYFLRNDDVLKFDVLQLKHVMHLHYNQQLDLHVHIGQLHCPITFLYIY